MSKKKGYTIKADIEHTLIGGSKGFCRYTMGMDGNFYIAIGGQNKVKPATFSTKAEASEFYFQQRKDCPMAKPMIEGPRGGIHHIIQWR